MEKQIELRKLSKKFYENYPFDKFPELERKLERPYVVLILSIYDKKFALPFRSNIRHGYCYKFRNTSRKTQSVTGIDFSKAVVIDNDDFLAEETNIDFIEYIELTRKISFIKKQFLRYVNNYFNLLRGNTNKYLVKRYRFSTLNYFKDELLASKTK